VLFFHCNNSKRIEVLSYKHSAFFLIDNMLHYKVILHVPVFLILPYVLLYNKKVMMMPLLIPQDDEFRSVHIHGLSSSVSESL